MRTFWGLGIGHIHAHNKPPLRRGQPSAHSDGSTPGQEEEEEVEVDGEGVPVGDSHQIRSNGSSLEVEDSERGEAQVGEEDEEGEVGGEQHEEWSLDDQEQIDIPDTDSEPDLDEMGDWAGDIDE